MMLVDACNVIGRWHELYNISTKYGLASARDELIERMVNYTAVEALATILVFDAYRQPHHKSVCTVVSPYLTVHFTEQGQTADDYIERQCAELRHQRRLIVVTSDRIEGWTVKGYGAELRSAEALVRDIKLRMEALRQQQQKPTPRRVSLEQRSKIKPSDRAKLEKMRFGLS